ncbi:hypothetical protein ACQP1G_12550 [Nocardia sp. CA-107356]|uniref:hypothetical protein n=1 Tax=Nocardia sp. CA-107356 TaxID=3239972 RepID=UPI003D8DFEA3
MAAELAGTAADTWQTLFGSPTAGNSAVPGTPFGPPPGAPSGPPPGAPGSQPAVDGSTQPGGPPPGDPSGQPPGNGSGQPPGAPGAAPATALFGKPPGATDTTATTTSSKAKTGHYWTVKLTPPPGASAGLKAFIAMAEEAIQTAVDLLGRGTPDLPPKVDDLLRPVIYESIGDSLMKKQYQEALAKVQTRQTALLTYDTKVMKTSIVVAAGSDETLRAIKEIVAELQTKLKAAGSGKIKPAQEVALMKLVAEAIDLVYEKVEAVYQLNSDMAGDGNNGSGSSGSGSSGQSGSGSSGGGSGDGGLGQLVSMLGMLPMMAMPLVAQLPQLLKPQDKDKDKDKDADGAQTGEGQPQAAAPGAAPGSPAPAAPPAGQPAAAAPAATASASAPASATPVANMSPVSARANVRRAVKRTGTTPTDTDTDETHESDPDDEVTVDSPVVQA